jgi:uncharacterized protein (TIGR02594 family)
MTVADIQRRLIALGYKPGPVDDRWGPKTRAAVIAFQRDHKLAPDGVVGPKTTAVLNAAPITLHLGDPVPPTLQLGEPIWVQEGRRKMGLHETIDNAELRKFLKSDGRTLGDPSKLPWCGDFVETCIRLALPDEPVPANPYLARNWLNFGVSCPEPVVGAVAVFYRGPIAGISGHVGFVVGQDSMHLSILGGNQSNTISVSRLDKARLLGCRWPKTAGRIVVAPMGEATGEITTNEA